MEKYRVVIEKSVLKDFEKLYKSGDVNSIKKIEKIIIEFSNHPYTGIGNPEPLKHNLSGYWSRRINNKDRIIYYIEESPDRLVVVISALGHY